MHAELSVDDTKETYPSGLTQRLSDGSSVTRPAGLNCKKRSKHQSGDNRHV